MLNLQVIPILIIKSILAWNISLDTQSLDVHTLNTKYQALIGENKQLQDFICFMEPWTNHVEVSTWQESFN